MSDLISRRAAIKAIDDLPNCYNGYSDTYDKAYIIGVLEELPTIEPQRWIPVTERLPDAGQWVLCQCRANIIDVLRLTDDGCWYRKSNEIYMSGFVLAWMPLPEPYTSGADMRGTDDDT